HDLGRLSSRNPSLRPRLRGRGEPSSTPPYGSLYFILPERRRVNRASRLYRQSLFAHPSPQPPPRSGEGEQTSFSPSPLRGGGWGGGFGSRRSVLLAARPVERGADVVRPGPLHQLLHLTTTFLRPL